jgi:hypothetical protein
VPVSVPIDWPAAIRHAGRADRAQAAESEDARGRRVWLAADGTIAEE